MTFGTQIFELRVDSEIKVYRDPFKKDIFCFGYMLKFGMKTFIVQLLFTI